MFRVNSFELCLDSLILRAFISDDHRSQKWIANVTTAANYPKESQPLRSATLSHPSNHVYSRMQTYRKKRIWHCEERKSGCGHGANIYAARRVKRLQKLHYGWPCLHRLVQRHNDAREARGIRTQWKDSMETRCDVCFDERKDVTCRYSMERQDWPRDESCTEQYSR